MANPSSLQPSKRRNHENASSIRPGGRANGARIANPIRSVGMKLFLLIFGSILLCVLSLGWFSYAESRSIIQDKVASASIQTADQTTGKLRLLLGEYERQSRQITADNDFTKVLTQYNFPNDDVELYSNERLLNDKLTAVAQANPLIDNVTLLPVQADKKTMTSDSTVNADVLRKQDALKKIDAGKGATVWLPTMLLGLDGNRSEPTIAVGRLYKLQFSYYLIIEVKLSAIAKEMSGVDFGEGGSAFVLDDAGTVVYSPDKERLAKPYGNEVPGEGSATITENGKRMLSVKGTMEGSGWTVIGNIPVSKLVEDASSISRLTWIISLLAALIAGGIGWIVMLTVGKPLSKLRTLMNEGEKGNLTVRSDIRKKDEIGQVSESFNRMMEEITTLVRRTNETAREVLDTAAELTDSSRETAAAAKEIAAATEEIAGGAANLASESKAGTELTALIGSRVQSVIRSNGEMERAASEVEQAGRQGTVYMGELIDQTGATERMTREMVEKVDKLKESTSSIRRVLELLDNMTKQTNILSLNAAIEAARAGASGKGFMVVADEIRKLADQSRESIGDVGNIVESISLEIEETVAILSRAYPIYRKQVESVKEANTIFVSVQEHMGGFAGRLDSATDSVRQLEDAQATLSHAMGNVTSVAQTATSTSVRVASFSSAQMSVSERLVRLSNRLESVSAKLTESLSRFNVA
ncbi:methyl-accepting chemotaxis protein [Cohnella suwonensis]|uniref:Methyl-accepting chemotaxis protein n=1 Tax=Cohnella suwonensis TaxID=696072 RepID=A0ABW0M3M6_9BACL